MPFFDVVIPARNEEPTIGSVVRMALQSRGVGKVIVVDDGSTDGTASVASAAGAEVLQSRGSADKGLALETGVAAATEPVIVFFDADILNVTPSHFESLAAPVVNGGYAMCCGLVDYGVVRNPLFLRLPPITGLRALRREIFEAIRPDRRTGFQIEIMINEVIARGGLPSAIRVLHGAGHRSKVEKSGWRRGGRAHLAMTVELLDCFRFVPLWTYWSYLRNLDILRGSEHLSVSGAFGRVDDASKLFLRP